METFGGYKVKNFKKIADPYSRDERKAVYSGRILQMPELRDDQEGKMIDIDVTWDKDGKVPNQFRFDCNISTADIDKLLKRRAMAKIKK